MIKSMFKFFILNSVFKGLKWRFIGPDVISGRCTDVAVPRGSRQTIYVGAATGGIWKTVNSGITWEPIMDDVPSISMKESVHATL